VVFLISYVPRGLSLSHEACRSSVELLQLLVYVFREVLRGVVLVSLFPTLKVAD